jgi:hypothetical protein
MTRSFHLGGIILMPLILTDTARIMTRIILTTMAEVLTMVVSEILIIIRNLFWLIMHTKMVLEHMEPETTEPVGQHTMIGLRIHNVQVQT